MAETPTNGQNPTSNETLSCSPPESIPVTVPTALPVVEVKVKVPLVNPRLPIGPAQLDGTR